MQSPSFHLVLLQGLNKKFENLIKCVDVICWLSRGFRTLINLLVLGIVVYERILLFGHLCLRCERISVARVSESSHRLS